MAAILYATNQYTGDGSNRRFPVNFPYLDPSHVVITVNNVAAPFTLASATFADLVTAPPAGSTITLSRATPIATENVSFVNGSTLLDTDLNGADIQLLYGLQDACDRITLAGFVQDAAAATLTNGLNAEVAARNAAIDAEATIRANLSTQVAAATDQATRLNTALNALSANTDNAFSLDRQNIAGLLVRMSSQEISLGLALAALENAGTNTGSHDTTPAPGSSTVVTTSPTGTNIMSLSTDTLTITGASPDLIQTYAGTGATTNQNNWRLHPSANTLVLGARTDDNTAGNPALTITRSGTAITAVTTPLPITVQGLAIDQEGVVNIGHYPGVDLTGATDASPAIQAALNLIAASGKGGTVLFPANSTVKVAVGLTFSANTPIAIKGAPGFVQPSIIQACQTLFTFDAGSSVTIRRQYVSMEDLSIVTNVAASTCIKIVTPDSCRIRRVRASAGSGYWAYFLDLMNIATSLFEDIYVRNDHGLGTQADIKGIMFWMKCTGGATDNRFYNCFAQGFDTAWYAVNGTNVGIEGQICTGCTILGCNTGILYANQSAGGYQSPQWQFLNGHMNVYKQWMQCIQVAQIDVSHSDLYLDSTFGNTDAGFNFGSVNGFHLSDLEVYFTNGARNGSFAAIGGSPIASDLGSIHDITGVLTGSPVFIQLQAGSKNTYVHHFRAYGAAGAVVVGDGGVNNLVDFTSCNALT